MINSAIVVLKLVVNIGKTCSTHWRLQKSKQQDRGSIVGGTWGEENDFKQFETGENELIKVFLEPGRNL